LQRLSPLTGKFKKLNIPPSAAQTLYIKKAKTPGQQSQALTALDKPHDGRRARREFHAWAQKGGIKGKDKAQEKLRLTGRDPASQNVPIWGERSMSKRILSVSYDLSLLETRKMLLEQKGYAVENAFGFSKALASCRAGGFDLFILGHSIPHDDKLALIESFRTHCPGPILSLERHGEDFVPCDYHASPDDPGKFLETIENILNGREHRARPRLA
jgi:CheY-like chemotaxis protein